jgi:hypothetical protein
LAGIGTICSIQMAKVSSAAVAEEVAVECV